MFAVGSFLAIGSYALFYWGWLAVRGYPAVYPHSAISLFDVILPSRLATLQTFLSAGPQPNPNQASASGPPGTPSGPAGITYNPQTGAYSAGGQVPR